MQAVPFEDITLSSRESEILDDLIAGLPIPAIELKIGSRMIQGTPSRLMRKMLSTMPDVTWQHLVAQEFIRRQDKIVREQVNPTVAIAVAPTPISDEELDKQFTFYLAPKSRAATA